MCLVSTFLTRLRRRGSVSRKVEHPRSARRGGPQVDAGDISREIQKVANRWRDGMGGPLILAIWAAPGVREHRREVPGTPRSTELLTFLGFGAIFDDEITGTTGVAVVKA